MTTAFHTKYFAHELTRKHRPGATDRLSMALFDACVDLNPHQIEAAMFAMRSPLTKGVILCDEVGLGKTIEAGLVMCQSWAERKRKILVVSPASLRKQWSLELEEKFNLPTRILDSRGYKALRRDGDPEPFNCDQVVIASIHYVSRMRADVRAVPWDLVVIDEAHKLRNSYRASNKMGQNIKWAIEGKQKLLLTATPLQNSLLELYGLTSVLDEMIFGDVASFRTQYTGVTSDIASLRTRIKPFCHRTLRRQVLEYIQYTERLPFTIKFSPTDDEQKLYKAVSDYLMRVDAIAIPTRQRHLTTLILRKLLASSSHAVASTLETMKSRLENLRDKTNEADEEQEASIVDRFLDEEDLDEDYLEETLLDLDLPSDDDEPEDTGPSQDDDDTIDPKKLADEIAELDRYAQWARSIGIDTKGRSLMKALDIGFEKMNEMGANKKALVFTESRRTQEYLKNFLETNGYAGQIVTFNGSNNDQESRAIIEKWVNTNAETGRVTGSRAVDSRTALIEHFRDTASVMIATEAASEGVNIQFCSAVINYDLPWNPQRIEQRIGRCHRYGQKHDVVVINFINERNEADRRVHELLTDKFKLFDGVFGASDEVLGAIESGVDFEKRILSIYQKCRTTEEIESGFQQLQSEMEESIKTKMDDTRQTLLEHFDEDVHSRLKMRLDDTKASLDRFGQMFWAMTRFLLSERATFDDDKLSFTLQKSPLDGMQSGPYTLISKVKANVTGDFLYRLSHPLGQWVIGEGKTIDTPKTCVTFDVTNYPRKLSMVEELKGQSGWLALQHMLVESFEQEEYLLFSAVTDDGRSIDHETCEKLFNCDATTSEVETANPDLLSRIEAEAKRYSEAMVSQSLEANNHLFNEERERLENWAEDMVIAAEKDLADIKAQIKAIRRQARSATTLDQQNEYQKKQQELEKKQRKQRQQIFDIEDGIAEKRDQLIDRLQKRMSQKTTTTPLFMIQWKVV